MEKIWPSPLSRSQSASIFNHSCSSEKSIMRLYFWHKNLIQKTSPNMG